MVQRYINGGHTPSQADKRTWVHSPVAFTRESVSSNMKEPVRPRFVTEKTYTIMLNKEVLAGGVMPEGEMYSIVDVSDYVTKHILGLGCCHLPGLFYVKYNDDLDGRAIFCKEAMALINKPVENGLCRDETKGVFESRYDTVFNTMTRQRRRSLQWMGPKR
jgi:hypothetical protein